MKDAENLTGEQSAIWKAQDILQDTVKSISSWDELHALMHENGMAYHKKGSGAVIQIGEVTIKASAVSRNLTLKNNSARTSPHRRTWGQMSRARRKLPLPSRLIQRTMTNNGASSSPPVTSISEIRNRFVKS